MFIFITHFLSLSLLFYRNGLAEEKRRIETKLTTLEEDFEEEQMNLETANEKARKAQQIADSLSQEVSSLQSNYQQSENNRLTLEKQVKRILYLYYEY